MKIYKLHRNSDFKNQPQGSSRLIINCNINYEFGSLTTEDGFDLVIEYPYSYLEDTTSSFNDKVLIGHILLPDNSLCLISQIADYQDGSYAEIAILKDSTYRPIFRAQLNLSDKFPIEGAAKLNNKGETLIYFTDYNNPQRWLNLTNPQVTIDKNLFCTGNIDELLYFPKYNNSAVNLISVENGGNLPCGAYIPVYKYSDKFYNETDVSYNSHVISLGDGTNIGPQYDGGIVNSNSGKQITLNLVSPDTKYTFAHIYLVYKAASSYVVYDCGYKNISNPIVISSLEGLTTVPLETVTVKRANYTTAKTVTQLDSVLYWGNLKGREDFDFQPYVNNIKINPIQKRITVDANSNEDYKKEIVIYNQRGFLYDEVYAFYVSFFIEDEKGSYETKAYHVPGRKANVVTYGGDATTPVITGGLAITYNDGIADRKVNLDENELLSSVQVNYPLNNGTGFPVVGSPISYSTGSLTNNILHYNASTTPLNIDGVYLLKFYVNGSNQDPYCYVKVISEITLNATYIVEIVKKSTNFTGNSYNLWSTTNGKSPAIFEISPINNDYVSNGLTNTDASPAGQMYTVNNNARVFHAFPTGNNSSSGANQYMGFWENQNENYAATDNWLVKFNTGINKDYNFKGEKVRHHKFPHASVHCGDNGQFVMHPYSTNSDVTPTTIPSSEYNQVNILGVILSNIVIPDELSTKIKKINVYYAKQNVADKLIIGQSIALHNNRIANYNPSRWPYLYPITAHSAGNIKLTDISAGISGNSSTFNFSPDRRFIRCSPFDNVSSDTISNVTHINVLYKLNSSYNQIYCNNPGLANPLTLGLYDKSTEIDYQWRMDRTNVYCVKTSLDIFNRAIKKYNYIDSVPLQAVTNSTPAGDPYPVVGDSNAYIYGTSQSIWHYKSDKTVLSELYIDLNRTINPNTVQNSADYIKTEGGFSFGLPDEPGNIKYSDIYLVNLCAFKEDLFQNFESKELVFAGSFNTDTIPTPIIYGGDTFSNYYGYRSTTDLAALFNEGLGYAEKLDLYIMKYLHYFICQSTSNINYRNIGTSDQDTYFPYTIDNIPSFLRLPLIPNGQANFYGYNKAYNTVNDINQPQIGEMYKMNANVSTFPTRIIRSAKDNVQSIYDNYRVVLANDYTDLPKDKGQIWSLKGAFNKLNIFFENTFRETMGRERLLTQSAEAYIGAGDIFAVPPRELTSADGGYAGSVSQWAINVTPYGLFFVDINRGRVFLKTENLEEISLPDMFYFFQQESKFGFRESLFDMIDASGLYINWYSGYTAIANQVVKYNNAYYISLIDANTSIPTDTTKWNFVFNTDDVELLGMDSVYQGFRSAFDPQYKRIILSKFDVTVEQNILFGGIVVPGYEVSYEPDKVYFKDNQLQLYTEELLVPLAFTNTHYFTTNTWTISYYPEYKSWGSFYTYYPDRIFSSNDAVYSTKRLSLSDPYTKLYEHNKQVLPYFYLRTGPQTSTVDAIFNPDPDQIKEFKSIQFKTKANKYIGNKQSQEYLTTFDYYQAYNSYQLSKEVNLENTVSARNLEGYWSINNFRDWFNNGQNIFDDIKNWALNFNSDSTGINLTKHWSNLKRFVDNWFAVRLKYSNVEVSNNLKTSSDHIYISKTDSNEQINLFVKITPPNGTSFNVGDLLRLTWSGYTGVGRIYDIGTTVSKSPTIFNPFTHTFTLNNHGLVNGTIIVFTTLGSTSGISLNTRYYIVNATTNTFQISTTLGGSIVPFFGFDDVMPIFNVLGNYYIELFDYYFLANNVFYEITSLYKIEEVKLSLLETVATYIKNTR